MDNHIIRPGGGCDLGRLLHGPRRREALLLPEEKLCEGEHHALHVLQAPDHRVVVRGAPMVHADLLLVQHIVHLLEHGGHRGQPRHEGLVTEELLHVGELLAHVLVQVILHQQLPRELLVPLSLLLVVHRPRPDLRDHRAHRELRGVLGHLHPLRAGRPRNHVLVQLVVVRPRGVAAARRGSRRRAIAGRGPRDRRCSARLTPRRLAKLRRGGERAVGVERAAGSRRPGARSGRPGARSSRRVAPAGPIMIN